MNNNLSIFYDDKWIDEDYFKDRIRVHGSYWTMDTLTDINVTIITVEVILDDESILVYSPEDTYYMSSNDVTYEMYVYICKQLARIYSEDITTIQTKYLVWRL